MSDWQFAIFLAQVASAVEAGASTSAPNLSEPSLIGPVPNDIPSLRVRISLLEGKILDLQRELRVQGQVARRASADEDFMLAEVNKAAEQLVCEYSLVALLPSSAGMCLLTASFFAVARLDEEEEGKRVAHLAEVLRKLSDMSNEISFWSDPTKREAVALLQVRSQQIEDLVERCRNTLARLYDAMFPLNEVLVGIGPLLKKFGQGQEVMNSVRAQIAAGAEVALAFVRSRYPNVDFAAVADGPLAEGRKVALMEGHYAAVKVPADRIVELLVQRSEECRGAAEDCSDDPKGKGKKKKKNKKGRGRLKIEDLM